MAQGREFIGASALTAGLIDKVATFDSIIAELVNKVALDSNKPFSNNNLNHPLKASTMTMSLNAQQLAVISAGGILAPEEIATATALAVAEAAQAAAVKAEGTPEEIAAAEAAAVAEVAAGSAVESTGSSVVEFLQIQLKEANASLLETTITLRALQVSSASAIENEAALLAIACDSLSRMNIALGGHERDLSGMSAIALLAEHSKVLGVYEKKLPIGGVAVAALDKVEEPTKATVSPLQTARLNAVKQERK